MKRYGYPLIALVAGSLTLFVVRNYISVDFKDGLMSVLCAAVLFIFGCYLSQKVGRRGWVKKLLVIVVTLLLLMVQMGALSVGFIDVFLSSIGATSLIYDMLYIYLGYIFF